MTKINKKISKVAILTSGGDAPGMNASIRAIAKRALSLGIEPFLVYEGFKGLIEEKIYKPDMQQLDVFMAQGGTHIYTSRYPNFEKIEYQKKAIANLSKRGIDGLIVIGGNGSYKGALAIHKLGFNCVAIPGTIDNDIDSTETTIGFNTALDLIVSAIDNLRNTAQSIHRLMLVETMGRYAPDLTIFSGLATGAEATITAKNVFTVADFVKTAKIANKAGKRSIIFVISELIYGRNGLPTLEEIAEIINKETNINTRVMVIGHLQRGGVPTGVERVLAARFGIKAIELLALGKSGKAVGNIGGEIISNNLEAAINIDTVDWDALLKSTNKMNI